MRNRRKRARTIISVGLCLMAACATAVAFSVLAIMAGPGSRSLFLRNAGSKEYYEDLTGRISDRLKQQLAQYGLQEDLAEGVIDGGEVYIAGMAYTKAIVNGGDAKTDSSQMKKRLKNNIKDYLMEYGLPENDRLEQEIKTLLVHAASEYEKGTAFYAARLYRQQYTKFYRAACRLLPLCVLCIAAASIVLWFLYHRKYLALRCLDDAVLGGVLAAAAFNYDTNRRLLSMQAVQEESSYSRMLEGFFAKGCRRGWILLLCGLCVWFILMLVTKELREKKI